jgi:hypothetical protein
LRAVGYSGLNTSELEAENVSVRTGTFSRFDPGTTRCPVAGPEGFTFVSIGCPRGSYEPRGPF